MNIGILGYGWLGSRIAEKLSLEHVLYTSTTSSNKIAPLTAKGYHPVVVNFDAEPLPAPVASWSGVPVLDVLIITVPLSAQKAGSAVPLNRKIQNLFSFIGDFSGQLFFMSTTGVYTDEPKDFNEDDLVNEKSIAENLLKNRYPQINILRLGGLMGNNRMLSNYPVSNLDVPVNHVHFADVVLIIQKMIEMGSSAELFNVVAPCHPTKREVIGLQKNIPLEVHKVEKGKTVSSEKMIHKLAYKFKYSDPRYFHLA